MGALAIAGGLWNGLRLHWRPIAILGVLVTLGMLAFAWRADRSARDAALAQRDTAVTQRDAAIQTARENAKAAADLKAGNELNARISTEVEAERSKTTVRFERDRSTVRRLDAPTAQGGDDATHDYLRRPVPDPLQRVLNDPEPAAQADHRPVAP